MPKKIASIAFLVLVASSDVRADGPFSHPTPNLGRLRRLEAFTRTIPPHRLSLNGWASSTDLQDPTQDPDAKSYGCVAAWSTRLFASEGFQLRRYNQLRRYDPPKPITVTYDGNYGGVACMRFFRISRGEYEELFENTAYNHDPAGAADAILRVIRRHDPALDDLAQVFAPPPVVSLASGR